MAFSINTNIAALAALQNLRETNADLTATQNAVSSGKKVHNASDDPAVYVIAQKMNSQISGLSAVSSGLSTGAQVVATANSALTSIGTVLSSIKTLVSEGQSASIDPTTINSQISNLLSNIDSYAKNATFSGVNLISGQTGGSVVSNQISLITNAEGSSVVKIGSKNSGSSEALNATAAGLGLANLSTTSSGVTFTGLTTIGTGGSFTVQNSVGTGTSATPAQSWTFTLATTGAGSVDTVTQDNVSNVTAVSHAVTVVPSSGQTAQQALVAAMKTAGFAASFSQSATAGAVDLHIAGNDVTTTGSTATPATGGTAVTGSAWNSSDAAIATVDAAIDRLGVMTTTLSAQQNQLNGLKDYASTLSDALTTGVGALTDADLSEESAKLTSLQTKQQLAIQSLSIANSQSQSILSLFR